MNFEAANFLSLLPAGELSGVSTSGAISATGETGGFSAALLEQLGVLQAGLADVVKPGQPLTAGDLAKLPADTQAAMQSFAALFGKNPPQAGKFEQNIDLDDTMQTLADVMQQLQALDNSAPVVPAEPILPVSEDFPAGGDVATDLQASEQVWLGQWASRQKAGEATTAREKSNGGEARADDGMDDRLWELVEGAAAALAATMPTAVNTPASALSANEHSPVLSEIQSLQRQSLAGAGDGKTPTAGIATDPTNDFERSLQALLQSADGMGGADDAAGNTSGESGLMFRQAAEAAVAANANLQNEAEGQAKVDFNGELNRLNQALPSAGAKAAETTVASRFDSPQWSEDLGQKLIWMHKQALPSAELRLNPEHLGPVLVKIDQHQDQTSIVFTAQHQAVRDAIESAIPKLREMFSGQQLQLADVNVSQHQANAEQRQPREFFQNASSEQQRQARGDNDAGLESEVGESLDVTEEIEAGRATVGNGLLSLFA